MAFAWWKLAACRDLNTDLFFDEDEFSIRRAREVCGSCPCLNACLDTALEVSRTLSAAGTPHHDVGVFAGLTGPERQDLIRPATVGQSDEGMS